MGHSEKSTSRGIAMFCIISAMLIFATSFLVVKDTTESVPPGFLMFMRAGIAALALLLLSVKEAKDWFSAEVPPRVKFFMPLFAGFTGLILTSAFLIQTIGQVYTTAARTAFLENTYSIIVPLFAWAVTKRRPRWYSFAAMALCVAGVILISLDGIRGAEGATPLGDILSAVGGACYGFNIVLTGLYAKKYPTVFYTALQFLTITLVCGVYTLIFEHSVPALDGRSTLNLFYLGLIVTALAWVIRNIAQRTLSPLTIGVILPFSAAVAAVLSVLLGWEAVSLPLVIGGALMLAAILLDAILSGRDSKK